MPHDDGILFWDEETLNKLSEVNIPGCATIAHKQLVMFGYMCG